MNSIQYIAKTHTSKDKWFKEQLDKQLYLQELSKYNLSLWEDNND